jgi:hypothetical protein
VHFQLDAEIADRVGAFCDKNGIYRANFLESAVVYYLEMQEACEAILGEARIPRQIGIVDLEKKEPQQR